MMKCPHSAEIKLKLQSLHLGYSIAAAHCRSGCGHVRIADCCIASTLNEASVGRITEQEIKRI